VFDYVFWLPSACFAARLQQAGFDPLKQQAIQQLGMERIPTGAAVQRSLLNGKGAWPGLSDGSSRPILPFQTTWTASRRTRPDGLLTDYTGGTRAQRISRKGRTDEPQLQRHGRYAQQFWSNSKCVAGVSSHYTAWRR